MIKINLVKKKKASGGASLSKFDVSNLMGSLKGFFKAKESTGPKKRFDVNQPIPKVIIVITACWFLNDTLTKERLEKISVINKQITETDAQTTETRNKLNKIKGYEPIKRHMEEDEREVRTKLEVVKKLLEDRNQPSKIMMHISESIPEEVWLTGLNVTPGSVKFSGATPGYNQVSDFIKALKSSTDYSDVALSSIQEGTQNASSKEKQKFQVFDLVAKRRSAL